MALSLTSCDRESVDGSAKNEGKRIALTYDDAPTSDSQLLSGSQRTEMFLRQLEDARSGPVGMFITTRGMDAPNGKKRVSDYAEAGHVIANHSNKHLWASRTPLEDYVADIDTAEQKLKGLSNRRAWYRFPFLDEGSLGEENRDGVRRDALRKALADRGLMSAYVTIDTYDWHLDTLWRQAIEDGRSVDLKALSDVYIAMVLDAASHYDDLSQQVLGRRPAHVLLLHENDLAASFTKDLIEALRADGWSIIHPDEAYADPIARQLPNSLFAGMGRVSALAADAGMQGKEVFDHWSASRSGIEDKVSEYRVFSAPKP